MINSFSFRENIRRPEQPITVRNEAPAEMRGWLFLYMKEIGLKRLRDLVCKCTQTSPDMSNWSENEFMRQEIEAILYDAKWYEIYDIIEAYNEELSYYRYPDFENLVNNYFVENGIGWQLKDKKIVFRDDTSLGECLDVSLNTMREYQLNTPENEIKEAIKDLSRRPKPDLTGVVQHAVAGLENAARTMVGSNKTLGKLVDKYPGTFTKPLGKAVEELFGYASQYGRHINVGKTPTLEDATLTLHLSAALISYFSKKNLDKPESDTDDLF